jgi:hypothetical protein
LLKIGTHSANLEKEEKAKKEALLSKDAEDET